MIAVPTQQQLLLPIMEVLSKQGGTAKPSTVVDAITDRFEIPTSIQEKTRSYRFKDREVTYQPWRKQVHWARMNGVLDGYISREKRGVWELTDKGWNTLENAGPGIIFTVFETPKGQAVWATAETAVGMLQDNSVNLIFTSPPYPLESGKKTYGNKTGADYLQWMGNLARDWHRSLADDGSLVLNLADVWNPKSPTVSLYIERLLLALCDDIGFNLAQRCIWECPNRIPGSYWVTHKRVRLNNSHEHLLWLTKSEHAKANNRDVLEPYKDEDGMRRMRRRRVKKAPSGHLSCKTAFHNDNGGRIPHSVLQMPNASSDQKFAKACRDAGLPLHPARMPVELAKFWIRFLTDMGDHVHDTFFGSGTTGWAAEQLGRTWSGVDRSLSYIRASSLRFDQVAVS